MLSPLKNRRDSESSETEEQNSETVNLMDFQTPLSITIPPNEYDDMEVQNYQQFPNGEYHQCWPMTFNQEPLLTSKSPDQDKLTQLNMQVGSQYMYRMHETESESQNYFQNYSHADPRFGYDKFMYSTAHIPPFKDLYYQCAYEEPKSERTAIRHKIDEDMGPVAKRQRRETNDGRNGQSVIVQAGCSSLGNVAEK
ncbi:unnamed protein product [Caenorhabditis sp. 36 PRJEB53466]|nr:unnamed protein product [Caenorhabditis sp. 36 PRJEB53466]